MAGEQQPKYTSLAWLMNWIAIADQMQATPTKEGMLAIAEKIKADPLFSTENKRTLALMWKARVKQIEEDADNGR
jgi:hypothetical protein